MADSSAGPPASKRPRILHHPWPPGEAAACEEAVRRALREGAVMTYPTETAYALGGNALAPGVADAVFRLKGRTRDKALLLLIGGREDVERLTREVAPAAEALMTRCWPGPLTLVFHAAPGLAPQLAGRRGTVALRWSSHPCTEALLGLGGVPLIGTSANPSGGPNPFSLTGVLASFPGGIELAVDAGPIAPGPPSTLLDTTMVPFRLLRRGVISREALEEAAGMEIEVPSS
ncbi:MAG: threonylcarbamoyl-AMP synthase [SAR324 cluster bacterium]|nr:threonylcarbamoyl-AMP synthase [SAR324 cluster bacterium]MCH8886788.1 threonylcarbamoyl-AMP synthase [SAR324 cluster bacterium]